MARVRHVAPGRCANRAGRKRFDGHGVPIDPRELDFESGAVAVDVHDHAYVACLEAGLGNGSGQNDDVVFADHGFEPGCG